MFEFENLNSQACKRKQNTWKRMAGEAADKKIYDAATNGDVATFKQVLQQDPCLLLINDSLGLCQGVS